MKKVLATTILAALLLIGCAEPVFETVSDDYVEQTRLAAKQIILDLPPEAAQPVMESTGGEQLYQCNGYELRIQTLDAGNLDGVLRTVTGYGKEQLTVMETAAGENRRYDCVWCSTGEEGELVGRTAILDDGSYCYCVSLLAPSKSAHELQRTWQTILSTLELDQY